MTLIRYWIAIVSLLLASAFSTGASANERDVLKVCADPNSMPLSNEKQEGYENRIAQVIADDLGIPLEFTWFPQRRGFVRHTLRKKDPATGQELCDLIIGVPESFELAITTEPYYRSTYALVFKRGIGLDDVKSGEDFVNLPPERRKGLRVGLFEQTPAAVWLAQNGMILNIVPYITMSADPAEYPGQIIERELANDKIDAAILWGPIAGYFVKKSEDTEMVLIPLPSQPGIRFDFALSMAVRFGEGEWKQQIESIIDRKSSEINAILKEYHVPLLSGEGRVQ